MIPHEYTPEQALELLLAKLDRSMPEIAARVRYVIAQGKEVDAVNEVTSTRKKTRTFRQKVPLTITEALSVAVEMLRAYFVELPLFINSAHRNFASCTIQPSSSGDEPGKKEIQIELVPETALDVENRAELMPFTPFEEEDISQQYNHWQYVQKLCQFVGE